MFRVPSDSCFVLVPWGRDESGKPVPVEGSFAATFMFACDTFVYPANVYSGQEGWILFLVPSNVPEIVVIDVCDRDGKTADLTIVAVKELVERLDPEMVARCGLGYVRALVDNVEAGRGLHHGMNQIGGGEGNA